MQQNKAINIIEDYKNEYVTPKNSHNLDQKTKDFLKSKKSMNHIHNYADKNLNTSLSQYSPIKSNKSRASVRMSPAKNSKNENESNLSHSMIYSKSIKDQAHHKIERNQVIYQSFYRLHL